MLDGHLIFNAGWNSYKMIFDPEGIVGDGAH
jgi:hypothetical protein